MSESEKRSEPREQRIESKEYGFDEGASVVVDTIEALLATGQECAAVSVNGSTVHVGKSRFTDEVAIRLKEKGITVINCTNVDSMLTIKDTVALSRKNSETEQMVILFTADSLTGFSLLKEKIKEVRLNKDNHLKRQADKIGLSVGKIDLRIGIYRPDSPFDKPEGCESFADIMIRNDRAVDKQPPPRYV